jgi:hypothetical protein
MAGLEAIKAGQPFAVVVTFPVRCSLATLGVQSYRQVSQCSQVAISLSPHSSPPVRAR